MRDHSPITVDEFNGLWRRGDADSTPLDHFSDCNNLRYIEGGFETRPGIIADTVNGIGFFNLLKIKNYEKVNDESLLLLDTDGNIYDTGSPTPTTPILTIAGMLDFGLFVYAGRAYISPSTKAHGMAGEFVYVYKGDGTPARKAAGFAPTDADGALAAANSATAGDVEAGIHIFGVVYETDTGFLTSVGPDTLATVNATGGFKVDLSNIPVSPNSYVVNVHVVASRAIDPLLYTGNTRGYELFFVPGAIVSNGTTTLSVSFFDVELLESASDLFDLYEEIPAGVGLTGYHGRMINWCLEPDEDQSTILVSLAGEPEAFNQVTGLIIIPSYQDPITICQELRDVLYIFRNTQTWATQDNNDDPSTWSVAVIDNGLGSALHGIATVLDIGNSTLDLMIIFNVSGIYLFNGTFAFPELSYKIADLLQEMDLSDLFNVEVYCDTILKRLYIIFPGQRILLYGDFQRGLDSMKLRWCPWTATGIQINSICLTQFNRLQIAAQIVP